MTCDEVQPQLTALDDGELPPELAAEIGMHLASCPACTDARAGLAGVRTLASAWAVDAPDVTSRVLRAVPPDEAVLEELRLLRAELRALRDEVAALRRHLPRPFDPYALPSAPAPARPDTARMESDPWNLTRY